MRRIGIVLLGLLLLCPEGMARASEAFPVAAKGAVLIEAGTGRILYAQNADAPLPMASTTKLMTCLLALENAELDEPVTAGENAHGVPGTSIYLSVGETLTMEQLLYGLMLLTLYLFAGSAVYAVTGIACLLLMAFCRAADGRDAPV